jgi:hypothetical protein
MLRRCLTPSDTAYARYGGRGITVCERWRRFENFLSDMGECPEGLTLDRIDNAGGYAPENCRWADRVTQGRNKSNNRVLEFKGKKQTLAAWAEELSISDRLLTARLNRLGWSVFQALSTPVDSRRTGRRRAAA